jgi:hypothetical protein
LEEAVALFARLVLELVVQVAQVICLLLVLALVELV